MRRVALNELLSWLRQAPPALARLGPLPRPTLTAVLQDLWRELFGQPPDASLIRALGRQYLTANGAQADGQQGLLLSLWLLQAPALRGWLDRTTIESVLLASLPALLEAMAIENAGWYGLERQEELARFWLRSLGLQPVDESPADSAERWELISSQRRQELLAELRRRRQREKAVRQAQQRRQQQW